jgi:hypothetical protein
MARPDQRRRSTIAAPAPSADIATENRFRCSGSRPIRIALVKARFRWRGKDGAIRAGNLQL